MCLNLCSARAASPLAATHAVFVLADLIRATIVPLAAAARIPAVYQFSEFVEAGALMTHAACHWGGGLRLRRLCQ
jgi:L-alanine-DL-glutamate epimerase-like enolase superfamily enzyme